MLMSDRKKEKVLREKVLYSNPLYPNVSHSFMCLSSLPTTIDWFLSFIFIFYTEFICLKKTKIINNYTFIKNCSKKCGHRCKKDITSKKVFWFPLPLPTCHTLLFFLQRHSLNVIPLKVTNYGIKNNNFFTQISHMKGATTLYTKWLIN